MIFDPLSSAVRIFFHRWHPEFPADTGDELFNWNDVQKLGRVEQKFIQHAHTELPERSDDELRQLFLWTINNLNAAPGHSGPARALGHPFQLLVQFAHSCLNLTGKVPAVKHTELLRWRMVAHQVGEDTLIAALLAYHPLGDNSAAFSWSYCLPVEPAEWIKSVLDEEVAENHFHLNGSIPVAALGWLRLVTKLNRHEKTLEKITGNRLHPVQIADESFKWKTLPELTLYAGAIRLYLFMVANDSLFPGKSADVKTVLESGGLAQLLQLQDDIESINSLCAKRFKGEKKLDYTLYALPEGANEQELFFTLSGERNLLINVFKKIFSRRGEWSSLAKWLHLYLLIKVQVRNELVQSNGRVGFANFKNYQDRKRIASEDKQSSAEAIRIALRGSFNSARLRTLEARIGPRESKARLQKAIKDNDSYWVEPGEISTISCLENNPPPPFFYVLHFIKRPDEQPKRLEYRHYELRATVRKQADVIIQLRESFTDEAARIWGIDAASSELGSRPEVFATAFRRLRNHDVSAGVFHEQKLQRLRATFHVGEDFLDLVSGLRAIDEAIEFLDLQPGERIGHALAMGLESHVWYKYKQMTVILSLQERIDNLAWMVHHLKKMNLPRYSSLTKLLVDEFKTLFDEIFSHNFSGEDRHPEKLISDYYDAWLLRGDDPKNYETITDPEWDDLISKPTADPWQNASFRNNIELGTLRSNIFLCQLYRAYHYELSVKERGSEVRAFEITQAYVDAVTDLQKRMREKVKLREIGVECNPTSNYLIARLHRYAVHPIAIFFNEELETNVERKLSCEQLDVSINTDDQGVFETTIDHEYMLLALAKQKEKDAEGQPLYVQENISKWLARIRKMGIKQSFYQKPD